jgi:TonB family protein
MKTALLLACCLGGLLPDAAALAQPPRDTAPPAVEMARRERDLRAAIAGGTATRDTYMDLAALMVRQLRWPDAMEALRGAAAVDPQSVEAQHRLGLLSAVAAREAADPAARQAYLREGIAAERRALELKPDYVDAMGSTQILLRMLANAVADPAERVRLTADADALHTRMMEIHRLQHPEQPATDAAADAPPFDGFAEPYEQTFARLQPVRVGGEIRQPTKVADTKPVYPEAAQAARVQGVVIIEALIDESGAIANARVLRSIPALDQAALAAVSRWRFTPTGLNGRPVGVVMTVTVNFTLQ